MAALTPAPPGMDSQKYRDLFVSESREHLQRCTRDLLAWERAPEATEPVAYVATRPDPLTVLVDLRNVTTAGVA